MTVLQPAAASTGGSPTLNAAALLAGLQFTDSAPRALAEAARAGDVGWFARQVQKRGVPRPSAGKRTRRLWQSLAELFPAGESATLAFLTREVLLACARQEPRAAAANHLAALLDATDALAAPEPRHLAAWLSLLPAASRGNDPELCFRLWRLLLVECRRCLGETAATESLELLNEVRLRASVMFHPLTESIAWWNAAREGWRSWLANACDDQGMPHRSRTSPSLWLGALTRATQDALSAELDLWNEEDLQRLRRLGERLAAWTQPGLGLVLAADSTAAPLNLQMFLKLTGWKKQSPPRRLVDAAVDVAAAQGGRGNRPRKQPRQPPRIRNRSIPSAQSDAARAALLRTDWGWDAALCKVDHSGPRILFEGVLAGARWLAGPWDLELSLDDTPLSLAGGWKCDCWYSDHEADFLELVCDLAEGMMVVRQVFLARQEPLLVLMDAVRGVPPQRSVQCRARLPLAAGVEVERDGLTRELQLVFRSRRVRVFPVHLPPQRGTSAPGALDAAGDDLLCTMSGRGSVCQVLMLDWSDRHGQAPADWTPLSVAEEGRRLSSSEAVASRLRVGDRHWFYWHNLTRGKVARSALGHHSASETVIARFSAQGTVEPLVHVEPEGESQPVPSRESSGRRLPAS